MDNPNDSNDNCKKKVATPCANLNAFFVTVMSQPFNSDVSTSIVQCDPNHPDNDNQLLLSQAANITIGSDKPSSIEPPATKQKKSVKKPSYQKSPSSKAYSTPPTKKPSALVSAKQSSSNSICSSTSNSIEILQVTKAATHTSAAAAAASHDSSTASYI